MAPVGSKRVAIAGIGDKHQIIAVFASTMSGDFLPPQIIYAGKTARCLPSVEFPGDCDITYTENHWANEKATLSYIEKILLPYTKQTKQKLSIDPQQPALVVYDRFKGQCTERVMPLPGSI